MTTDFSWMERFYSYFLGRDICHIFSGALFICVVEYAIFGEVLLPKGLSLESFGFLLGSYFLGLTIMSLNHHIGLSGKVVLPKGYSDIIFFTQDMIDNYDDRILNRFERIIFMMNVGQSVGLSSLFGAIFMIIHGLYNFIFKTEIPTDEYMFLVFSLLIYGIYMIFDTRTYVRRINNMQNSIAEDIKSKTGNQE